MPVHYTRYPDDLGWLSLLRSPLSAWSWQLGFSTLNKKRNTDVSLLLNSEGKHPKAFSSQGLKSTQNSASLDIPVPEGKPTQLPSIRCRQLLSVQSTFMDAAPWTCHAEGIGLWYHWCVGWYHQKMWGVLSFNDVIELHNLSTLELLSWYLR